MKQYVCDRCGNIIKLYNTHNQIHLSDANIEHGEILYGNEKYNRYDFCDECLKVLYKINENFVSYDRTNEEILESIG